MKQYLILGLFFSIVLILGCNMSKNHFDSSRIKSSVWNLDISDSVNNGQLSNRGNSLYKIYFNHRSFFFIKDKFYFGSIADLKDSCVFLHDTLLITESYIKSGVESSSPITDTLFMGKITNINSDSLRILRIKDKLFDGLLGKTNNNKILRFYNDSLITRKETKFKAISISSGLCYGSCPMQAVEIDSLGNLFFCGGKYAFKKGNYKGKLNTQSLDTIEHFLSAALINRDVFKLYGTPKDAPGTEMKIILENNDTITVDGEASSFNFRLWQIYYLLNTRLKTANLVENTDIHKFISTKYIETK